MIKLFASDMDGTLLTNHVEIHKNNVKAIRKLQKLGKHFIVCTGRDYLQANFALEQANLHLPVIAMNGAQIFDKKHDIIWEVTIPHDTVYTLLDYFDSIDLDWQLVTSEGNFRKNYALFINKVIERKKVERNNLTPEQLKEEIKQLKILLEATDVTTAEEVLSIPDIKVFKIIVSHDDGSKSRGHFRILYGFGNQPQRCSKRHCRCPLRRNTWIIHEANFCYRR